LSSFHDLHETAKNLLFSLLALIVTMSTTEALFLGCEECNFFYGRGLDVCDTGFDVPDFMGVRGYVQLSVRGVEVCLYSNLSFLYHHSSCAMIEDCGNNSTELVRI
jgi:hypothetical protein